LSNLGSSGEVEPEGAKRRIFTAISRADAMLITVIVSITACGGRGSL
jgi:hypothetical protein